MLARLLPHTKPRSFPVLPATLRHHSTLPKLTSTPPTPTLTHLSPSHPHITAFTLHPLLTPSECTALISYTESEGYIPALLNTGTGDETYSPNIRKSSRCIIDSKELASQIWDRIKPFMHSTDSKSQTLKLNPRVRFLKYTPGDFFQRHRDGSYTSPSGQTSKYTLQIYLNDGEEYGGGETGFWFGSGRDRMGVDLVGKMGMAVVFQHNVLHEGRVVVRGCKYVVRTDVMAL